MEDISSIALIVLAILSLGIRLYKKANAQPDSKSPTPVKRNRESKPIEQEEESEDLPMPNIYDAPSIPEKPIAEQRTEMAERPEMAKNPSVSDDFDLAKAVIYSEILKPKFDEE